jgi:hypothetical protein
MLERLIAPHVIWRNEMTCNISDHESRYVASLRRLAQRLCTPTLEAWAKRDFRVPLSDRKDV